MIAFLPFVTEVWQVYVLIFFLQAASAGFTPAFQAVIPDVLTDEDDYTNALSLSRLAEDLEQPRSRPMLAAALLTVVSFPVLFAGTVLGFIASAVLVVTARLPSARREPARHLGPNDAAASASTPHPPPARADGAWSPPSPPRGRWSIVNTVVLVQARLGLGETRWHWPSRALAQGRCWRRSCCPASSTGSPTVP